MRSFLPASAALLLSIAVAPALTAPVASAGPSPHADAGSAARVVAKGTPNLAPPGTVLVGNIAGQPVSCIDGATAVQQQSAPGSPVYTVPGAGVLTSVLHNGTPNPGTLRLLLLGPETGTTSRSVRRVGEPMAVTPYNWNSWPVRLPVAAGTALGMWVTNGIGCNLTSTDLADLTAGSTNPDPTSLTSVPINYTNAAGRILNIAAVWEPDADGDGYGDVTQDACPQSARAQAACPAPETTIGKAPAASSTKRKVKVTFRASVDGATFICALDGKDAKPCTSPFKVTVKYGKHTLRVTAVSALGIPDPTPATTEFRVRKPR